MQIDFFYNITFETFKPLFMFIVFFEIYYLNETNFESNDTIFTLHNVFYVCSTLILHVATL